MKRGLLATALALAMTLALTACGNGGQSASEAPAGNDSSAQQTAEATDWKWERNIEIVCPWGTGGGADTTLRAFTSALEKEVGVKVVVNNKAGAGGVTGVQFASQQPTDGYSYLMATQSPVVAQISGATDFDVYGTVRPLIQMVQDVNVLVAGKDEPYNNLTELVDYIKKNPGSVKAGVMTITGLDAACLRGVFGDTLEPVAYTEGSQLNADIVGGHINLGVEGPAEVKAMVDSGDMKVICAFTDKPLTIPGWEKVQTSKEAGYDVTFGPGRGIFYFDGTPEAAVKAFEAAAEKALNSEEFKSFAKQQGLDQRQGWKNMADYQAAWKADYEALNSMFGQGK